jgi:hypothetical protein
MTQYSFTNEFRNELIQLLSKKIDIVKEEDLEPGYIKAPVDLYNKNSKGEEFIIELEIRRADPSNNIAKIGYWLEEAKDRVVSVIQVFTPYYDRKTGSIDRSNK